MNFRVNDQQVDIIEDGQNNGFYLRSETDSEDEDYDARLHALNHEIDERFAQFIDEEIATNQRLIDEVDNGYTVSDTVQVQ